MVIAAVVAMAFARLASGQGATNAMPGLERRIVVAPAETVYVADAGAGDAVVLIPPILGSAFQYRQIAPLLVAEGFRVLAVELPGVARGSRPRMADYSLTAQADRIMAVLDSLGVERAFLGAHSVGGSIAMRVAYRHPDRVRGVLLLEAGISEEALTPGFRRALTFEWLIRLFGGMGRIKGRVKGELVGKSADPSWVSDEIVEGYLVGAGEDLGETMRAYKAVRASVEPDSLAPNLSRVVAPVLLLLGGWAHDGGPPAAELERMSASLPAFAIDTVPDVGHFPHEESPAAVAEALGRLRSASPCVAGSSGNGSPSSCLRKEE
jgi:pimeloyl-ACP methyl ester carboxylesterase